VTSVSTDEQTLALYNFDEGQGDVLKDASGNGHDGKIIGATWIHSASGGNQPSDPASKISNRKSKIRLAGTVGPLMRLRVLPASNAM